MIFTSLVQKAIQTASFYHKDQKRKESNEPYIVHPLAVGIILSHVTSNEAIIVAGILHDIIEDTLYTSDALFNDFTKHIAQLVLTVTEEKDILDKKTRKELLIKKIVNAGENAILIKSADVLHNIADTIHCISFQGMPRTLKKDLSLWKYQLFAKKARIAYPRNPLMPEVEKQLRLLKKIWK